MKLQNRRWWDWGKWEFRLEYNLLKKAHFRSVEIRLNSIDNDRGVGLFIGIPRVFDYWFEVSHSAINRYLPTKKTKSYANPGTFWDMPITKKIGASWHDSTLWWSLWETCGEWSNTQPWWWGGAFNPKRFLLGRSKYSKREVVEGDTVLAMPEGDYPVEAKIYTAIWKRPRWPSTVRRVELDFPTPVPVPGKGESSWDMDDDAIHSTTMAAETVAEALDREVKHILNERLRHGGRDWIPDAGWPVTTAGKATGGL